MYRLRPLDPMDGISEPTGTKLQEQVLHSAAARRVKYMDVFYRVFTACRRRIYSIAIAKRKRFDNRSAKSNQTQALQSP